MDENQFKIEVLLFIRTNSRAFTRTMYKQLNAKGHGFSLNKFRDLLKRLASDGKIKANLSIPDYPYWEIV